MSAHEQMRRMLDELMGTGRNGEDDRGKIHFTHQRVCKSFLLNCCPHDILSATRYDLGECRKLHDVALRADYEAAAKEKDYNFHAEALEHLKNFIAESERRTQVAKRRLAETQEVLTAEETERLNKIHALVENIGQTLAKAEQLGAEGKVEESLKLMETVEEFRKEKAAAEQDYRNSVPASISQQQKLRVCEVCSSYLGLQDNDRRLADHFNGKLHLGFISIREKVEELEKTIQEKHIKKILEEEFKKYEIPIEESSTKRKSRSRSRSPKHSHDKGQKHESRSSSHSRSRSHKHRHRSRSHEEDRKRHKSDRKSESHSSRSKRSHRSESKDHKKARDLSSRTEKKRSRSSSSSHSISEGRSSSER